ncbi:MAG: hypothetical protein JNM61_08730 [Zoogloeaceae bacterium]|nr:hypothetical protein [Zoogloeaceae bacterium]
MTLATRIEKLELASGEVEVVTIERLIVTAKDGKPDPGVPVRVITRPYQYVPVEHEE